MKIGTTEVGTVVELRCKSGYGTTVETNRLLVDADGDVRVWDRSGEYWRATVLSDATVSRARKFAGFGK